jgi:hypothetical protein
MKSLTRLLGVIALVLLIVAQRPQCNRAYWQHNKPDAATDIPIGPTLQCGVITANGTACRQIVAKPGQHCRFHANKWA